MRRDYFIGTLLHNNAKLLAATVCYVIWSIVRMCTPQIKGKESAHTKKLDSALEQDYVLMGDMILLDILQGLRSDADYNKAKVTLAVLDQTEMIGNAMVYKCTAGYRTL